MANQCDFVETQLSASAQFGSNCCQGGPYFALSRRALLYTDDHDNHDDDHDVFGILFYFNLCHQSEDILSAQNWTYLKQK